MWFDLGMSLSQKCNHGKHLRYADLYWDQNHIIKKGSMVMMIQMAMLILVQDWQIDLEKCKQRKELHKIFLLLQGAECENNRCVDAARISDVCQPSLFSQEIQKEYYKAQVHRAYKTFCFANYLYEEASLCFICSQEEKQIPRSPSQMESYIWQRFSFLGRK